MDTPVTRGIDSIVTSATVTNYDMYVYLRCTYVSAFFCPGAVTIIAAIWSLAACACLTDQEKKKKKKKKEKSIKKICGHTKQYETYVSQTSL